MAWKDFRNGMKEKRSGGKRKIITDLNSCFTSLTEKRFQESWEDTNKSSIQKKIHIYYSNAQMPTWLLAFLSLIFTFSTAMTEKKKKPGEEIYYQKRS